MLNVCVSCPVITASGRVLLYVKCLCELSRYHSPVVEVCYMINAYVRVVSLYVKCLCELSRYHSPVEEVCYMLNVCASCPVITAQWKSSVIC